MVYFPFLVEILTGTRAEVVLYVVLDEVFLEIHCLCAVELLGDPLGLGVMFSGPRSKMRDQVLFQGPICVGGGGLLGSWFWCFSDDRPSKMGVGKCLHCLFLPLIRR